MNIELSAQRKKFGLFLKGIRNREKMTLHDLQDRTGIKYSAIAAIEQGTRAAGDELADKLADGLKLKNEERQDFLLNAASTRIKDRLTTAARDLAPPVIHYVALMLDGLGIKSDQILEATISTSLVQCRPNQRSILKSQIAGRCENILKSVEQGTPNEPFLVLKLKDSRHVICTLITAEINA